MSSSRFSIASLQNALDEAVYAAQAQFVIPSEQRNLLRLEALTLNFNLIHSADNLFEIANSSAEYSVSAQYTNHVDGESVLQIEQNIRE